jgi:ABC-2 type transport system ATP-binding protein
LDKIHEILGGKKLIKLQFSEKIERNILERFGSIREYGGFNVSIEVNKDSVRHYSSEMLENLPVIDFNIEDIPIEEGITMLYQKGVEQIAATR